MDPPTLQLLLFLQIVLEVALIVFMIVFFMRLRRLAAQKDPSSEHLETSINHFIAESDKLSAYFAENLEKKKELSLSLLLKLERKINQMNQLHAELLKGEIPFAIPVRMRDDM